VWNKCCNLLSCLVTRKQNKITTEKQTTNPSKIWHNSNNWELHQHTRPYTHEIIKADDITGMFVTSQIKISWPSICCLTSILFELLLHSLSTKGQKKKLRVIVTWALRRIYGRRHVRGSNRKTIPILFFNFTIIYRLHLESVHMKLTSFSSTFWQLFIKIRNRKTVKNITVKWYSSIPECHIISIFI